MNIMMQSVIDIYQLSVKSLAESKAWDEIILEQLNNILPVIPKDITIDIITRETQKV